MKGLLKCSTGTTAACAYVTQSTGFGVGQGKSRWQPLGELATLVVGLTVGLADALAIHIGALAQAACITGRADLQQLGHRQRGETRDEPRRCDERLRPYLP